MDEKDQNFNVLGGFEDQFQPSAVDFLDFPFHCKGNLKGNQENELRRVEIDLETHLKH